MLKNFKYTESYGKQTCCAAKQTDSDIAYLEEMYVPHPIVGAINHNAEQGVMLLDEKK